MLDSLPNMSITDWRKSSRATSFSALSYLERVNANALSVVEAEMSRNARLLFTSAPPARAIAFVSPVAIDCCANCTNLSNCMSRLIVTPILFSLS